MGCRLRCVLFVVLLVGILGTIDPCAGQVKDPQALSVEQRQKLDEGLLKLRDSLDTLRNRHAGDLVDAAIFEKGVTWALRYDQQFTPADVLLLHKALDRGGERIKSLATENAPWRTSRGPLALGYVSRIDGSVQPYGVVVPRNYDPKRPIRLDVVLHGSTRPVGMTELRFLSRFDQGDDGRAAAVDQPFIELHPLGRVENCYRWAGETDVFEAIDDVCRRYNIDRERIVLRGMSMGASGTWHLGLKHPDTFVALGPYCGYVDTHRFSHLPFAHFVKVGPLPEWQELGLHMLDSIDYAANAGVVPAIACMGEKDEAFEAHVLMAEAMRRDGLQMVNLISPGTGHVIDPVTQAEQMRLIGAYARLGRDRAPATLRYVTWTLKYNRCHWLEVLGLERHYARAELSARLQGATVEVDEPKNVTRFAVLTSQLADRPQTVQVGTTKLELPPTNSRGVVVARTQGAWRIVGDAGEVALTGKRPGLQGPIDDAFTAPFVCVRGTGRPWNPAVGAYADAALTRFADEWHQFFRGELPVKDDTALTDEDVRTRHLILFGDPGSNSWIAKALPNLPLNWTRDTLRFGGREYPSADHLPALIGPNSLPGGDGHYLVVNSGHTFRGAELAKLNYLLFPRWGDWAVLKVSGATANLPLDEQLLQAGYFDEQWKMPAGDD